MSKLGYYWDLVLILTTTEIKLKYKNHWLGYIWSIASPMAFALVYYFAFKIIMRVEIEHYALFLIAGLFPWQCIFNSILSGSMIYFSNASLVKKVNFPKFLLPLATIFNETAHFIFSIPVILLFSWIFRETVPFEWILGFPIMIVIQITMTYGAILAISSINVIFRDSERLVGIFMTLLFFSAPIIYSEDMIPDKYQNVVLYFHPFAAMIINWRSLFLNGSLQAEHLLISLSYSIIFVIIGSLIYRSLSKNLSETI